METANASNIEIEYLHAGIPALRETHVLDIGYIDSGSSEIKTGRVAPYYCAFAYSEDGDTSVIFDNGVVAFFETLQEAIDYCHDTESKYGGIWKWVIRYMTVAHQTYPNRQYNPPLQSLK